MKDKECQSFDLTELHSYTLICLVSDVYKNKFLEDWAAMTKIRKPIIAAVSGYAVSQASYNGF